MYQQFHKVSDCWLMHARIHSIQFSKRLCHCIFWLSKITWNISPVATTRRRQQRQKMLLLLFLYLSLEMGIKSTRQFEFVHLQIFLYFRLIQPRLLTAISPPNHFRGKKYNILLLLHDSHLWYTKIIYIVGSCIIIFFF